MIKYPVRCKIVDVTGMDMTISGTMLAVTPEISKPHIGKEGLAELLDEWTVRITLDDGNILYGYECWWVALE